MEFLGLRVPLNYRQVCRVGGGREAKEPRGDSSGFGASPPKFSLAIHGFRVWSCLGGTGNKDTTTAACLQQRQNR